MMTAARKNRPCNHQSVVKHPILSAAWMCVLLAGSVGAQDSTRDPPVVTASDFGAVGDGIANDTAALQDALAAACAGSGKLYVPAGTYNISSPLITGCTMFIFGDGSTLSTIRQTVQRNLNHAIISNHSLTLQDIGIHTAQLSRDYGMAAVFRSDTASPASGQMFTFSLSQFWI
jgi:hypothetical protein